LLPHKCAHYDTRPRCVRTQLWVYTVCCVMCTYSTWDGQPRPYYVAGFTGFPDSWYCATSTLPTFPLFVSRLELLEQQKKLYFKCTWGALQVYFLYFSLFWETFVISCKIGVKYQSWINYTMDLLNLCIITKAEFQPSNPLFFFNVWLWISRVSKVVDCG